MTEAKIIFSPKDKKLSKILQLSPLLTSLNIKPLADIYGNSRRSRYINPIQVAPKKAVV